MRLLLRLRIEDGASSEHERIESWSRVLFLLFTFAEAGHGKAYHLSASLYNVLHPIFDECRLRRGIGARNVFLSLLFFPAWSTGLAARRERRERRTHIK